MQNLLGCVGSDFVNGAPLNDWSAVAESEHFVQFYEQDAFLAQSVCAFIGAGFRAGDVGIVIATRAHCEALDGALRKEGFDVAGLRRDGKYVVLDAAETLEKFMLNGVPNAGLFTEVVGDVMAEARRNGRRVRAFGEMVALLWADGKADAAIQLEQLWNNLAEFHSFALLCAYPLESFRHSSNGDSLVHICSKHSRVIPAESYAAQPNADARLRAITVLQQKAASLEAEIAERREAEKALARRERELRDFLENATEGIHQVGADGRILWANKAELKLLGYTAEEYIGHHITEFHADQQIIADILERLQRHEELHDCESRLRCKDGSIRDVSINSNAYWEQGRFVHTRCFTRDITERKQAAAMLEQIVRERTAELQETVAELEAFSYSISHDIRAPLRSIRGFADILTKECSDQLTSECRSHLHRICAAGERMDRLIQDVLTFSRVSRTDLKLEPVNLDHLVRGILECYPHLQDPETSIVIEGPLPTVRGNAAALTQCVSNLLGNAVKFVAPGTQPSVRVWSEFIRTPAAGAAKPQGGPAVRLYVRDNGIGIPKDAQDKIFAIFQRLGKNYEGTGIGLAIVKKAAERMGGSVDVSSEPGKGSTFWIELKPADIAA